MNFTYADFVDCLHGGTVRADCRPFGRGLRPLSAKLITRDWASLPSYDFGHLLDEGHPEFIKDRIKDAIAAAGIGMKDEGLFSVRESAERMGSAAYLMWLEGRKWLIAVFAERAPPGNPMCDEHLNIAAFGWSATHGRFLADAGDQQWAMIYPPVCAALLRNPKLVYEMADTSKLGAINQRQKARKLGAIQPTIRVLRLTKKQKIGVSPPVRRQGGSHASPVPHDRSGYTYTRANGRQVHVKGPIAVRGGKAAAAGAQYRVVA